MMPLGGLAWFSKAITINEKEADVEQNNGSPAQSDALVIFGVTGDLAHKMIFPALYAMAKRGVLTVPVIGVAAPKWNLAQLRKHVQDSIEGSGGIDNRRAFDHLLSLLVYVHGDYKALST